MNYTDVMVDLETVGTAPGSGIISIGAVAFEAGMNELDWRLFEVPVISTASCRQAGLTSDPDTVLWWEKQEPDAKQVFEAAKTGGAHIAWALTELITFFPTDVRLWGNGADFDNVLLNCAFKAVGLQTPWKYSASRCYRTLKREILIPEPKFKGTRHNALADALHQTRHLQQIWAVMRTNVARPTVSTTQVQGEWC